MDAGLEARRAKVATDPAARLWREPKDAGETEVGPLMGRRAAVEDRAAVS